MSAIPQRQVAGFLLSPDWVEKPKLSEPFFRQMKEDGYAVAILFIRHMFTDVRTPLLHDCIAAMTKIAHKHKLKFVLDTDHHWWGARFAEENPAAALIVYGSYGVTARDGAFEVAADLPRMAGMTVLEDLAAIFLPTRTGFKRVPPSSLSYEWQNYGMPKAGVRLRVRMRGSCSGPVRVYVAFRNYGHPDVSHPAYLKAQKEMLEQYRDIPLDGFGWDEPGKGMGLMNYFKAGEGFRTFYKKRTDSALEDDLVYLDQMDGTAKAAKVRCAYYDALNEMNLQAQDKHNRHAKKLFGKDIILGTHQTWSGLPTDLAGGTIDYFRLGKVLTGAWTDGSWWCELKYMAFHYMLADGLRLELGFRDAWYNDWTKKTPAIEDMHFATRYKMLFHVHWFNIFFSLFTETEVNFRFEPLRTRSVEDVKRLDAFSSLLGDHLVPQTEIAWLYAWEGMAAAPKWLTRVAYSGTANMAQHLVDRGLYATMMSPASIARARIGTGRFTVDGRGYRALVAPHAHALPQKTYETLLAMAEAGVAVIFVGPMPEFASDTGKAIGDDFARRVGMEPLPIGEYQRLYAEQNGLPAVDQWEPEWMDLVCPLRLKDGTALRDAEDATLAVRAKKIPLYYMPLPDPREDLCNLLEETVGTPLETFAERTYVRLFADPRNPEDRLILAAAKGSIADAPLVPDRYASKKRPPRKHSELKALVNLPEGALEMTGGNWCAVRLRGAKVIAALGHGPVRCIWQGEEITIADPAGRR